MTLHVQFYITAGILALATEYPFPCSSLLSAYICICADLANSNIHDSQTRQVTISRSIVAPGRINVK